MRNIEDLKNREAIQKEITTSFQLTVNRAERNILASVEWVLEPDGKANYHQEALIHKHRLFNFHINELTAQRYLNSCQAKVNLTSSMDKKLAEFSFIINGSEVESRNFFKVNA